MTTSTSTASSAAHAAPNQMRSRRRSSGAGGSPEGGGGTGALANDGSEGGGVRITDVACSLGTLDPPTDHELYEQIENLYSLDPALRTLDVLANTLPRQLAYALAKWMRGGQFGFLFDNPQDTISFSRFQCFDFQQMNLDGLEDLGGGGQSEGERQERGEKFCHR